MWWGIVIKFAPEFKFIKTKFYNFLTLLYWNWNYHITQYCTVLYTQQFLLLKYQIRNLSLNWNQEFMRFMCVYYRYINAISYIGKCFTYPIIIIYLDRCQSIKLFFCSLLWIDFLTFFFRNEDTFTCAYFNNNNVSDIVVQNWE